MSSYRLLRSNKETGPFSQEEIIAMGFKPYDLIWVDGKSAGWRYPSEFPEFKDYAPVVEEQPFDRFYKKPVVPARGTPLPQNYIAADPVVRPEATTTAPPEINRPAYSPAAASVGRHIHVTLPSGNTLNVTTLSNRTTPAAEKSVQPAPEERKPSFAETISAQPLLATVPETLRHRKVEETIETDSIRAGSNSHYYSAPAPTAGFSWTTMMGMIIGIATLVGLGVMIGLSINRGKPELAQAKENNFIQPKQSAQPAAAAVQSPAEHVPVIDNTATPPAPVSNQTAVNTTIAQPPVTPQKQPAVEDKAANSHAKTTPTGKKEIKQTTITGKPADKPAPEVATREKEPIVVHPKTTEVVPAVNLEKQVNIRTNGYKVGAFGGISDLQCTVVNDSHYALESVEVELQYIQANDKVFKTEKLSFRDIGAGSQVTMNAPKSTRGIKIISRIVKINTREPGLAAITLKS